MLPSFLIQKLKRVIDVLFDRMKNRFLGKDMDNYDKPIGGYRPQLSLLGLYLAATQKEGARPNPLTMQTLAEVTESYLDAQKERTKALLINKVSSAMKDAVFQNDGDRVEAVIREEMEKSLAETRVNVHRIVSTETQNAKAMGAVEAIVQMSVVREIADPHVYFLVVRDDKACSECKRLHLMEDEITPRVWKLSEVKSGYHKKGENSPCIGGLHNHCRCQIVSLSPGWGFDSTGRLASLDASHDEFKKQRGE